MTDDQQCETFIIVDRQSSWLDGLQLHGSRLNFCLLYCIIEGLYCTSIKCVTMNGWVSRNISIYTSYLKR